MTIWKSDFLSFFAMHLELIDFQKEKNLILILDFYLVYMIFFTIICYHFHIIKLLSDISISIPGNFIFFLFIIGSPIFTRQPAFKPSITKFSISFFINLLNLCTISFCLKYVLSLLIVGISLEIKNL